jgi:NADPH2:quinone reductase
MNAYIVDTANGEFRQIEVPTPSPAQGQVLVRISASGVNPLDTKIRAGQAAHAKQSLQLQIALWSQLYMELAKNHSEW